MSDEFVLPDRRRRLRVAFGGISATHVVREETFAAAKHPGMFTRKAWDRRALCGSLRACVIGGLSDASNWGTEFAPVDHFDRVTCARCRASYARLFGDPA